MPNPKPRLLPAYSAAGPSSSGSNTPGSPGYLSDITFPATGNNIEARALGRGKNPSQREKKKKKHTQKGSSRLTEFRLAWLPDHMGPGWSTALRLMVPGRGPRLISLPLFGSRILAFPSRCVQLFSNVNSFMMLNVPDVIVSVFSCLTINTVP